jgi:hypothetical protein
VAFAATVTAILRSPKWVPHTFLRLYFNPIPTGLVHIQTMFFIVIVFASNKIIVGHAFIAPTIPGAPNVHVTGFCCTQPILHPKPAAFMILGACGGNAKTLACMIIKMFVIKGKEI